MRFSIITCTYNSEQYLQRNIDSVEGQDYQEFEHIFIDGLSKDRTMDIIKQYQKRHKGTVKVIQSKPQGIANAMNLGVKHASGEYVMHLHSDDSLFDSTVLSDVARAISTNHSPAWIYGKAKFINEQNGQFRIVPHRRIYHKTRFWLLSLSNYIPHQAVFIRRDVLNKFHGFDEKLKNSMDYDLWLRLTKEKIRSVFINRIVCNFSVRADAQSAVGVADIEDLALVKKYYTSPFARAMLLWVQKINHKRTFFR